MCFKRPNRDVVRNGQKSLVYEKGSHKSAILWKIKQKDKNEEVEEA